jgi:sugar phosphate isomerase/epimerase
MDNLRCLKILARGATILGSDLLTLCTGTRNQQDMWTYHPGNESPAAWQAMIDAMWQALDIATEFDLNLGIEPEVANVVSNANDAARLIRELRSSRIRIVFDPANLYRPPADPRTNCAVITDGLTLLANRIAIAHCKDITASIPKEAGSWQDEPLYSHVAAGEGILNYRHYLSELRRMTPTGVPLILHGLKEEQIPRAVAFIRRCMSEVEASASSDNI